MYTFHQLKVLVGKRYFIQRYFYTITETLIFLNKFDVRFLPSTLPAQSEKQLSSCFNLINCDHYVPSLDCSLGQIKVLFYFSPDSKIPALLTLLSDF